MTRPLAMLIATLAFLGLSMHTPRPAAAACESPPPAPVTRVATSAGDTFIIRTIVPIFRFVGDDVVLHPNATVLVPGSGILVPSLDLRFLDLDLRFTNEFIIFVRVVTTIEVITTTENFNSVEGLIRTVVQDPFGSQESFSYPEWLQRAYGGNLNAIQQDLQRGILKNRSRCP